MQVELIAVMAGMQADRCTSTSRGSVGATVGAVAGGLLRLIGGPAGLLAWFTFQKRAQERS